MISEIKQIEGPARSGVIIHGANNVELSRIDDVIRKGIDRKISNRLGK